jgi:hypothetical protein
MVVNYHEDRANILISSFVLLLCLREPRGEEEERTPAQARLEEGTRLSEVRIG